jgi:Zn-dependent peptidase ImmA (M78 family)/DNA-binding XRE family transcriptional regulator
MPESSLDPKALAERIAAARKAAGKTQEDAAALLGLSRPTYIAIEKGLRPVQPQELVKLAAFFGRSVNELVRSSEPVALEPHLRAAVDQSRPDTPELLAAISELERFVDDYCELERLLNAPLVSNPPPQVQLPARGGLADFAEDVAVRERDRLQLGDQPILSLRRVLEQEVGVRVFFGRLPSWIAGMYAFASELGYCIFINKSHPPERQRMSMAHEYAHFLADRYRPGIDYLERHARKPANERFAEAFGLAFLMPRASVRRYFNDIVNTTGDFRVADLVRLTHYYFVSAQAAVLRMEQLGLIGKGWWDHLSESGFRPAAAKHDLNLQAQTSESQDEYPERYLFLAVQAFQRDVISEGQLARFLRTDRVTARGIVESCLIRRETQSDGGDQVVEMPFERSLLANAQ